MRSGLLGATGLAAVGLVGCGSDDDDDGGTTPLPTLSLDTPTAVPSGNEDDPFAGAVQGGKFSLAITGDPPNLDVYRNPATNTKLFTGYVYSRLFKYRTGPGRSAAQAEIIGDLAEGAENSPDGLEWVVSLKPNARFHDVNPVNGRAVTSDDVRFSWERATGETGINKSLLEFVDRAEFLDDHTIKFSLREPNAAFLDVLSDVNLIWVQPAEADGGFSPDTTAIGSGPFLLDSYEVGTRLAFKRNPNWFEDGFPLVDEVDVLIIPEYANVLAQFQAGNIDVMGPTAEDLLSLRQQKPDSTFLATTSVSLYNFYFDKTTADAPWRDERVRQAMSMALDRDAINELVYNVSKLNEAGLDFTVPYNNIIPVGFGDWWLDPQGSNAGPGGEYFKHNPERAKQLLAEAGYPDGFEAKYQFTANAYGSSHNLVAEVSQEMLSNIGIRTTVEVQDYASVYYAQTYRGNFTGIAFGPESSFNEPGSYPLRLFTPNPLNKGGEDDEELSSLAVEQQRELNPERRLELIHEIQRIHNERLYVVPNALGGGPSWAAYQPNVRNANNFAPRISYMAGAEAIPYFWKAAT